MKKIKLLLSILLSTLLALAGSLALAGNIALAGNSAPATDGAERTLAISTVEDFLAFADDCTLDAYSKGLAVTLEGDIDLTGKDFGGAGWFQGTFDGQGHCITGLVIERDGVNLGLFRTIGEDGVVKNLNVEGRIIAGGTAENVGGIAGENNGAIINSSFDGRIEGLRYLGGIAGRNEATGTITSCKYSGSMQGEHQVGGIAGENLGTISLSRNLGSVNTEAVSQTSKSDKNKIEEIISGIYGIAAEDILDIADIGGIAGLSSGAIYGCRCEGNVGYRHIGYNVGGICGRSSGFISDCQTSGKISGKNDVGGICGQIEPYSQWDLSESNLTKLEDKFNELERNVNVLKENVSQVSSEISGAVASLVSASAQAGEAFAGVVEEASKGTDDAISALQKTIDNIDEKNAREELKKLAEELEKIAPDTTELTRTLSDTAAAAEVLRGSLTGNGGLYDDATNVVDTVNGIFNIGLDTAGSLGLSEDFLQDISVVNAYLENRGAVDGCTSTSQVEGDTGVGGIAGSINFEVSMDPEDELGLSGYLFGNARYEVFAVIRDCEYSGNINVKKLGGGGALGKGNFGVVVDCRAICTIEGEETGNIGGIAGYSDGTVLNSFSRGSISGGSNVGGIAGRGKNVAGCVAYCRVEGKELTGGVCGSIEGECEGNYHVASGLGAVDGVDYKGKAEEITFAEMCRMENVPADFKKIEVTFEKEGQVISKVSVKYGGSVDAVPEVAAEDGRYWVWDEFENSNITNSITVGGTWKNNITTIATEGDVPEFLAEGSFTGDSRLIAVRDGNSIFLEISGFEGEALIRMKGTNVLVYDSDGRELEVREDGSYSLFTMRVPGTVTVAEKPADRTWIIWVATGCVAVAALVVIIIVRKRRKK